MYELDLSKWSSSEQFSVSNTVKKRLLLLITTVCSVVYIPLTVINFAAGYYIVCTLNILYILTLTCSTAYVYIKKRELPQVILILLLLLLVMSCTAPIYFMGITGALWGFPIITAVAFLLPSQIAFFTNSLIVLSSSFLCLLVLETPLAIRMIVSLCANFFLVSTFSRRIRSMQQQLRDISNTDPMTGAYNRRLLMDLLKDSFADYQRYETPSTIAIVDLDHFKNLNDTRGHDAGDRAIIESVRVIRMNTRKNDRVFRLGGDEILLLLRNITEDEADEVLQKICNLISHNNTVGTTASIGATSIRQSSDIESWIKLADSALYEAKRTGRNQVVLYRCPIT